MPNIYNHAQSDKENELVDVLLQTSATRIERIVSDGHCSPEGFWYDQDENEWIILLSGAAALKMEENASELLLTTGDYLNIPAHQKHRVQWTEKNTVWLCVFYR